MLVGLVLPTVREGYASSGGGGEAVALVLRDGEL